MAFNIFTDLFSKPVSSDSTPFIHTNIGAAVTDPAAIALVNKYHANPEQVSQILLLQEKSKIERLPIAGTQLFFIDLKSKIDDIGKDKDWFVKHWKLVFGIGLTIVVLVGIIIAVVMAFAKKSGETISDKVFKD